MEGSLRFSNEIELHRDIVGIKQIVYANNTGKNNVKLSILVNQKRVKIAPIIFRKASTRLGEKRSAIIPTKTGDIIAAIAAVP